MTVYVDVSEEGVWEFDDSLRPAITAILHALVAAEGAQRTHYATFTAFNGVGGSEVVVPKITSYNPNRKIPVIKEIRACFGMSLKDAKDKSEEAFPIRLPAIPMYKAVQFQKAMADAGAVVEVPNALERLSKI